MARCNYYFILLFSILLMRCETALPPPSIELDKLENTRWRYSKIEINGVGFERFDQLMEVDPGSSFRNILDKRGVQYNEDHTYLLDWDNRGEYSLGTPEAQNWQPSFGYWHIATFNGKEYLIHNSKMDYEQVYEINTLSDRQFVRTSIRKMSNAFGDWQEGEEVVFKEFFFRLY